MSFIRLCLIMYILEWSSIDSTLLTKSLQSSRNIPTVSKNVRTSVPFFHFLFNPDDVMNMHESADEHLLLLRSRTWMKRNVCDGWRFLCDCKRNGNVIETWLRRDWWYFTLRKFQTETKSSPCELLRIFLKNTLLSHVKTPFCFFETKWKRMTKKQSRDSGREK